MFSIALEWFTFKWLEISTLIIAFGGLLYAHLAYRTSERGLTQAKLAELTSLRIQAKSGLNDARQAQVSLELTCQIYRANWANYNRKQPQLSKMHTGIFQRSPTDAVQFEGKKLLEQLSAPSENLDAMDLQALEALMQKAKATSLSIQALAGKLESPP
jgi:hypothetical protein